MLKNDKMIIFFIIVIDYRYNNINFVFQIRCWVTINKWEMPDIAICQFFSDKLLLNLLSIPVSGKGSDPVRKKLQNTSLLWSLIHSQV